MRRRSSLPLLLLLALRLNAQAAPPPVIDPASPIVPTGECAGTGPTLDWESCQDGCGREPLASNRNFPNFIGYISNPLQNIDPRSLTQVVPIFGASWVSTTRALPDLDAQLYGPAISLALTDRLCVGLNQGGYAVAHLDRNDPRRPLFDRLARTRGQEFGGTREGFLNLGGFAQYTLIEDVENQFLATAGMRVVVPCGSYEIFQGKGPAILAPYLTVGKEVGEFHFLATAGYQFPARSGSDAPELFYLNAHLDRRLFGWLYPLVEVNWTENTKRVSRELPTRFGFIDFNNFASIEDVVTVAGGANLVLMPGRLELGAVYTRAVSTERNVDIDNVIVKMVLRY